MDLKPVIREEGDRFAKPRDDTLPRLVYGVWIRGQGWLKNEQRRYFSDLRVEYAEQAARLAGGEVRFFDESMLDFEWLFLEREQRLAKAAQAKANQRLIIRLKRWIGGVLGHGR